ncbi:MAG: hypothetical protein HC892_18180 [Saprospiraceae bacterium]|nr:hypothetical protein [Saprospiraceae bacterium]
MPSLKRPTTNNTLTSLKKIIRHIQKIILKQPKTQNSKPKTQNPKLKTHNPKLTTHNSKMYLAPLNYDRYFKKVFSEPKISKRFLEDFFDIQITEIELMSTRHKLTDAASGVEFDFRCKLSSGEYVIIDMQQWYKTDIIKRFYMYHSMNTVLQLEKIPDKSIDLAEDKTKEIKDYNQLVPVYTLIWLADDNLGFEEDYVSYTMVPETLISFIRNKNLWKAENVLLLLEEQARVLKTLDNKTKKLDFLQQKQVDLRFSNERSEEQEIQQIPTLV